MSYSLYTVIQAAINREATRTSVFRKRTTKKTSAFAIQKFNSKRYPGC